ncbi:unnamed protein product [Chrysodeixis includens]|uniref:Uncharacterized protein n=1 Tax=Chrysodeixis includens TaxID=689277 RepID=A0A9N8PZ23_CHRIL|nr:unnamed protein product [Chrysodeixis includens]
MNTDSGDSFTPDDHGSIMDYASTPHQKYWRELGIDILDLVCHNSLRPSVKPSSNIAVTALLAIVRVPGAHRRAPPALRDLARKNSRSAEHASRTVGYSGSFTYMLILAADFRGKRERRAHAEPPMISGRWPTVGSRAPPRACAAHTSQQTVATQLT